MILKTLTQSRVFLEAMKIKRNQTGIEACETFSFQKLGLYVYKPWFHLS